MAKITNDTMKGLVPHFRLVYILKNIKNIDTIVDTTTSNNFYSNKHANLFLRLQ